MNHRLNRPEAIFYKSSPVLTPHIIRDRLTRWSAGEHVSSGLVAVGHVAVDEALREAIRNLEFNQVNINTSHPRGNLSRIRNSEQLIAAPAIAHLLDGFLDIANQDKARGGLIGKERTIIRAREHVEQTGWHVDPHRPFVRYTMTQGENSSTVGMTREQQEPFEPGTVLRLTVGVVHATPPVTERDVFMSHTVDLAPDGLDAPTT
jgi:hypothetical protein